MDGELLDDADFQMVLEDLEDIGIDMREGADMLDDWRLMGADFYDIQDVICGIEGEPLEDDVALSDWGQAMVDDMTDGGDGPQWWED